MRLEEILRVYVMHQQWKWEEYLPLVEFTCKNGYQESLRMSPFEALHGWSYNTPIIWSDLIKNILIGPGMLAYMEHVVYVIKKNLKVTWDRHKSYANQNRLFKEFQVGEHVYFPIKPKKSSL